MQNNFCGYNWGYAVCCDFTCLNLLSASFVKICLQMRVQKYKPGEFKDIKDHRNSTARRHMRRREIHAEMSASHSKNWWATYQSWPCFDQTLLLTYIILCLGAAHRKNVVEDWTKISCFYSFLFHPWIWIPSCSTWAALRQIQLRCDVIYAQTLGVWGLKASISNKL